jgi:hypothetical protein
LWADATAPNGQALAQLSNDRTDYRFPLAIYRPTTGKYFDTISIVMLK